MQIMSKGMKMSTKRGFLMKKGTGATGEEERKEEFEDTQEADPAAPEASPAKEPEPAKPDLQNRHEVLKQVFKGSFEYIPTPGEKTAAEQHVFSADKSAIALYQQFQKRGEDGKKVHDASATFNLLSNMLTEMRWDKKNV